MLTVAICTYNRERYLPQLFESILNQTANPSDFEIVVVNNNSTDNTERWCSDFISNHPELNIKYVVETNQGLSFARNRAIEESTFPYITFLDDDAFIEKNYLQGLIDAFEAEKDVAALGGPIFLHYETIIPKWENKYLNSLMGYYVPKETEFIYSGKDIDYPRGSNMSFRTSVFQEVGMFNTKLGRIGGNLLGGEEKDIFSRIYGTNKYKVVYKPSLIVYHSVPAERTTFEFIKKQAHQTGISERIRSKHEGSMAFLKRCGIELFKWGASILLYFAYLFKGQPAKGSMILSFRKYVTKGLLGSSTTAN